MAVFLLAEGEGFERTVKWAGEMSVDAKRYMVCENVKGFLAGLEFKGVAGKLSEFRDVEFKLVLAGIEVVHTESRVDTQQFLRRVKEVASKKHGESCFLDSKSQSQAHSMNGVAKQSIPLARMLLTIKGMGP